MNLLNMDEVRYAEDRMPNFQRWYRYAQCAKLKPVRILCNIVFCHYK